MADTPYPLPRQTRQTAVLSGDGVNATYGPFAFKIFDIEDVLAYIRPVNAVDFAAEVVTVEKVSDLPLDYFTVTFDEVLPANTQFVVSGDRLHERTASLSKGTQLSLEALEKELSKQAAVLQELRRNVARAIKVDFDLAPIGAPRPAEGHVLGWKNDKLVNFDPAGFVLGGIYKDSVAAIVASTDLKVGDQVGTYGYYGPDGVGSNLYKIVPAETGEHDGGSYIDLANGLQAEGIFEDGVYPEHFGAKLDASLDDEVRFVAAHKYSKSVRKPLLLRSGGLYRSGPMVLNESSYDIIGESSGENAPIIFIYGDPAEPSLKFCPTNPINSLGVKVTNIKFKNFVLFKVGAGSTAAGFHGVQAVGVEFENVSSWGHKFPYLMEGCSNVFYDGVAVEPVNFAGDAGSAKIKIAPLTLDNGSVLTGFTHRINAERLNENGPYESSLEIAGNDFTSLENAYWGHRGAQHILIKPANSNTHVISLDLTNVYLDGGAAPLPSTAGIVIDMNGTTAEVDLIDLNGGTIGQMEYALKVVGTNTTLRRISLNNVSIQNIIDDAISIPNSPGSQIELSINGGRCIGYGFNGGAKRPFTVGAAKSVQVFGWNMRGKTVAALRPLALNCESVSLIASRLDNHAGGSPLDWATVSQVVIGGLTGNVPAWSHGMYQEPLIAEFADDAAAGAGASGYPIRAEYRTGSVKKIKAT